MPVKRRKAATHPLTFGGNNVMQTLDEILEWLFGVAMFLVGAAAGIGLMWIGFRGFISLIRYIF